MRRYYVHPRHRSAECSSPESRKHHHRGAGALLRASGSPARLTDEQRRDWYGDELVLGSVGGRPPGKFSHHHEADLGAGAAASPRTAVARTGNPD